jgi:hypothetical protein
MKGIVARALGLSVVLAASAVTLTAGETPKAKNTGTPLITDWTQRHVIFSQPRTPEQAARVRGNIRYQQQIARHTVRPVLSTKVDPRAWRKRRRLLHLLYGKRLHRDWSFNLGSSASVGEGRFPAKYSFDSTVATCISATIPDFVVFPTNLAGLSGAGGQATIAALSNLYAGCGGTKVPAQYWGYNTGGIVNTSPVISLDGTQIAFTQKSGGAASLMLLRWTAGGSIQNPQTPTPELNNAYPTCVAPCMTPFPLGANDTNSSVYYDYGTDVAFVGDDAGFVHQYTGVFNGTPAEVGSPWPVQVGSSPLTSPVFDPSNASVYVGDTGGFLYRIDNTGTVTKSGRLDFGTGLTEGPVIDAGIGVVYAFSSKDVGGTHAGVFQLPANFASGATGTEVAVGNASATTPLYNGGFSHDYIMSANSTGRMYVCGNPGGVPTLYGIPIAGGIMGTPVAGSALSNNAGTKCSPVTDVYNPTLTGAGRPLEWVFMSVHATGTPTACGGVACVMSFRATPWEPNTTYSNGQLILDSNMNIQVLDDELDHSGSGTSGGTQPAWQTSLFGPTTADGNLLWRNQGPLVSTPANAGWIPNHPYPGAFEIIDSNNNIQIAELPGGTSVNGTHPVWATNPGGTTTDNDILWYNLGANPVAGLGASGGTSGIIMDNTVTVPGGSQVYFSNLQDFGCIGNLDGAGGGTGGCAVQAAQFGLQ